MAVLIELAGVISEHLRKGDRVRIDDFGLLKLEIEGDKFDSEELEELERQRESAKSGNNGKKGKTEESEKSEKSVVLKKSEKTVVRGVRLHVLAESRHGRQALYEGIRFEKAGISCPPRPPREPVSPRRAAGSLFCEAQTSWKDISRAQSCSLPVPRASPGTVFCLQTAGRPGR